ncbi:hypothetical protein LXL04_002787 [Taraxacum kok-saghyz]
MFSSALLHAPTPTVLIGSSSLSPSRRTFSASNSSKLNCKNRLSMASSVRIVIVGDVHDDWILEEDSKALELLRVLIALLDEYTLVSPVSQIWCCLQAGDFGNENVKLVRSIAALKIPKAAILGNHDAWNTITFSEKGKDAVQLQLESLGEEHVGYKRLDFHSLKISVIGGRPFSNGGQTFFRKQLLTKRKKKYIAISRISDPGKKLPIRYGVGNMKESAKRICEAAIGTPKDHSIIILAHNGPTGLGSNMNDICGRDWIRGGGDHGDPDLAVAISQLKGSSSTTKYSIPLVVFGHMHKELAFGNSPRKMIVIGDGDDNNTIYLNGAIVPRVKTQQPTTTLRAFTLINSKQGKIQNISETWVSVTANNANIEEEHMLFTNNMPNAYSL